MRRCAFLLVVLLVSFIAISAQTEANSNSQVNAQALVNQMFAAAGWNGRIPASVAVTGTVSSPGDPTGEQIQISAMSDGRIRSDLQTTEGVISTVDDGRRAGRGHGNEVHSNRALAGSLRVPVFPFFYLIQKKATAQYLGTELLEGESVFVVKLTDSTDTRQTRTNTLWISRSSGLLLQISYDIPRVNYPTQASIPHTRRYSHYRSFGSVLIPLHQEDYVRGNKVLVFDFTDVQLDSVTDSGIFAITEAGRE